MYWLSERILTECKKIVPIIYGKKIDGNFFFIIRRLEMSDRIWDQVGGVDQG